MSHDDTSDSSSPENGDALRAFEEKQQRELREFEAKQRAGLDAFEQKELDELKEFEDQQKKEFKIKIDRTEYTVHQKRMSGLEIRNVPNPPIGPDRDLFEVVPGGSDRKILDDEVIKIHDGLRFFTAPAQINPGQD